MELLEAGINVISAVNIQHIESLNDEVRKMVGVDVKERIPDSVLREADEVVNIDLTAEELVERLKAGKIYAKEKIQTALDNFFNPKTNNDYASQITEKQESITSLTAEIASISANIDTLKADLKEKKSALKKTEKEVASLKAKKAKADAKAAEEAKKTEAEAVLKKLLASGMSADEILEKLK